jgi:hypothetical protein
MPGPRVTMWSRAHRLFHHQWTSHEQNSIIHWFWGPSDKHNSLLTNPSQPMYCSNQNTWICCPVSKCIPLNPYLGLVASQDPVQFKGSGAWKRLSAKGGVAYGTPRNWSTCFQEVPNWMAWDLPSSWPWVAMDTEGANSERRRGSPMGKKGQAGRETVSALIPGFLSVL